MIGGYKINMKFADDIFRKSCCNLKEDGMKGLGVEDETIEVLCDIMLMLLKAWEGVFRILRMQVPTEEIMEEAREKIKEALKFIGSQSILPKV